MGKQASEEQLKALAEEAQRKMAAYRRGERQEQEPPIKKGPRGGRYTEDKTKDGRPYRRYF